MKVTYKYISGCRIWAGDWSTGLSSDMINKHIKRNEIEINKIYTICDITIKIISISEKSKPEIRYSLIN